MIAQYSGADRKLAYLFENAREVSISPILTTGTQIATLTIDGQTYTLYCTTGGGGGSTVSYNSLITSGTALGELTIDGVKYTIYSKDSSKVSYAATQASGQQIGTLTIDGTPYVLYAPDKVGDLTQATTTDKSSVVGMVNELDWKAGTFGIYTITNASGIRDFIDKLIRQADADLSNKPAYKLYNIFSVYQNLDVFYGVVERQDTHGYSFSIGAASGNVVYRGYCDIPTSTLNVYSYTGTIVS